MTKAAIARRASEPIGLRPRIELATAQSRERSLWTFLTWSFFLSQIIAGQHLVGSAAAATSADEHTRAVAGAGDAPAADGPGALEPATMIATDGGVTDLAGGGGQVSMPAGLDDHTVLGLSLEPIGRSLLAADGDASDGHAAAFGPFAASLAENASGVPAVEAADTAGNSTSPLLDDILAALPDTIDGMGSIVNPNIGGLLDGLTAAVITTVDGALNLASTAVDGAVTSVVSTADDIVHAALIPVDGAVAALDGVTQGLPLPVGASAMAAVTDLVLETASSLTASVSDEVKDIVVDGSSIVLNQVADMTGTNDLFANGRYTPYNLALQDGVAGGQGALPQSMLTPIENALADSVHLDFITGDTHSVSIALPSALEEIGLRGLGDSLS